MDQDRRHIQAADRPDAAHGAGRQGVDARADGAFGIPGQVVLFDPATDTSPYAAQHVKPKKRGRAPAEKPTARRSASAAVPSDPTGAWSAYPAGDSPRATGRPAARPTAGRGAGAQGSGARNPRAAAQTTGSWLRIVTDDPGEIARYAQEQHGREATAPGGARRATGHPAAHDARENRPGSYPQPDSRTRAERPVSRPQPSNADEHADLPNAEPLPPEPAAWSTYDIDDDPDHPRPTARRRAPKAAPGPSAAAPDSDQVVEHARVLRRELDSETVWRRALVAVTAAAAVFITVAMLYFPAQRLYLAARENERLTDELEQNLARNEQMRDRVASLQTAEGIQDEARRSYNLVMPDESAVSVVGADYTPPSNAIPAEIPRGSGENTDTWATNLLDHVFGVTGAGSSTAVGTDVATVTDQPAAPADASADIVAQGDEAPAQP